MADEGIIKTVKTLLSGIVFTCTCRVVKLTPNNSNLLAIEKIEKSLSHQEFETSDQK